jgi:membrane protein
MRFTSTTALLKQTYDEWSEDKGPRLGAALAYYAIFSIPPLMMLAIGAIGFIYSGNIVERLQVQLATLVGAETARTLLTGVEMQGTQGGIAAGLIGLGVLFFGASGVFAELQDALNTIWGVKPKEDGLKGLIKGRFTAFTMVLGICFLLLISLVVSAVVSAMSERFSAWLPGGAAISHVLEMATSFAVITLLFAMIFKVLPDVKIGWNDVWTGAVVTAVLFTIGKFVIGTYIGKAGIGSAYGAAGSIVILITWVYYSAQILYYGAEFTQVYAKTHGTHVVATENAEPLTTERRAAQGMTTEEQKATSGSPVPEQRFARESRSLAGPRPTWNYVAVAITWLGTSLLLGRKGSNSNKRAA